MHSYFASTTMPFADRQNAGIIAGALSFPEDIHTTDVTGSQRAGLSALIAGLEKAKAGAAKKVLVVSGDRRKARAGATQEFQMGDGAAAFVLGADNVAAKFLGSHSISVDFVDHFRGESEEFDYGWEERWIRDEGFTQDRAARGEGAAREDGRGGIGGRSFHPAVSVRQARPADRREMRHRRGEGPRQPRRQRGRMRHGARAGHACARAGRREAGAEDSRRGVRPGLRRGAVRGDGRDRQGAAEARASKARLRGARKRRTT